MSREFFLILPTPQDFESQWVLAKFLEITSHIHVQVINFDPHLCFTASQWNKNWLFTSPHLYDYNESDFPLIKKAILCTKPFKKLSLTGYFSAEPILESWEVINAAVAAWLVNWLQIRSKYIDSIAHWRACSRWGMRLGRATFTFHIPVFLIYKGEVLI